MIIIETLLNKFAWNGLVNITFIIFNMIFCAYYFYNFNRFFKTDSSKTRLLKRYFICFVAIEEVIYIIALFFWYYSDTPDSLPNSYYAILSDNAYILGENYRAIKHFILLGLIRFFEWKK